MPTEPLEQAFYAASKAGATSEDLDWIVQHESLVLAIFEEGWKRGQQHAVDHVNKLSFETGPAGRMLNRRKIDQLAEMLKAEIEGEQS